jgi:hypothetical protein
MMVQTPCRSLLLAAALSGAAPAVGQSTSPLGPNPAIAGERTQVMTLGTFHLSERKDFDLSWLEPLLARLSEYRPAIITYEGVSGEQCAMMKAAPDAYADAFDSYCWDLTAIEKVTGLTVPAANAEIRKTLASWPTQPGAAQRRRLAMLFIAAGERPSAMVQWLRLPIEERHAGDGIDTAMLEILNRTNGKKNENYDIAAAIAARLGQERVYPVDDHTADAALAHVPAEFEAAQQTRFEGFRKAPLFLEYQRDMAGLKDGDSVLAFYRKINAPHAQDAQIKGDFGGALAADSWGRQYVGWWEARNLRMAANIRASFVRQPGTRILNIVGSSHKPWYDALMRTMSDVEVVDAETVLR